MINSVIKLANQADAQFIALLSRITFSETFRHLFTDQKDLTNYLEHTFSVQKIQSSIIQPHNVYWIAFVNQLPVGYAKLKLDSKSEFIATVKVCQLQKIYVLKDFLSLKIGTELQSHLLIKAYELGYK